MSNSNQEIIEAKLASYIDGELDPADRAELEVHLEQNPQYRRLVEELRKGREMLRGLPRMAAPPELAEAFTSQLERSVLLEGETDKPEPRMRIGMWPRVFATAAIVFLTFGLAAIVYFVLPSKGGRLVAIDSSATTRPSESGKDLKKTAAAPFDDKESLEEKTTDQKNVATADNARAKEYDERAGPDHLGKNLPAVAGASNASNNEDAVAEKKAIAKSQYALRTDRDAELEKLALNVSSAPQVKELLSNNVADKSAGDAGRPVVMVVRTNDPAQAKKELYAYLDDNKIDWQVAPARIDTALKASPASQREEMKRSNLEATHEQRLREQNRIFAEKQNVEKLGDAAPTGGQASKRQPETAAKGAAPAPAVAKPSAAPAVSPAPPPAPRPPAPTPTPAPPEQIVPAPQQQTQQRQEALALQNAAPAIETAPAIENLYVARRLSRRQADELSICLSRNAEVRKAGAGDAPAGESVKAPQFAVKDEGAPPAAPMQVARNAAPAAINPQSTPAQAGQGQGAAPGNVRKDSAGPRGGAVDGPVRRGEDLVKKGDQLRLSYAAENGTAEKAETVKVKEDGTIEPQSLATAKSKSLQAAGKTVTDIEKELRQSTAETPAPTAPLSVKVWRMESDRLAGGAGGGSGFGAGKATGAAAGPVADARRQHAASAPALGAATPTTVPAAADSLVDVVIVFEREAPAAAAQPATSATRVSSPTAATPPATQPASASPAK